MAQFVKLGKRRINLDAVAMVCEQPNGGATIYFNAGGDEDGTLPFQRINEQEKTYLLHILDWLDATPVAVSDDSMIAHQKTARPFCCIPSCGRDGDVFINGAWYCRVHKEQVEVRG